MKKTIAAVAAVAICVGATADEVWSTVIGDVIYEKDMGEVAVLSYPMDYPDTRGHVFIMGLGGNFDSRGHFTGYWSEPQMEEALCGVAIVDGNGLETTNWGRVSITFLDEGFPSSWVALRGECFEEPSAHLVGNPVVAPGVK